MKDKDFDDIFSKGLSGERKLVYDERDWEKLEERLDTHDNSGAITPQNNTPSRWKLLPWVGLLLLFLLGANSWFLFKMNQSENAKTHLLDEINNLKTLIEKQNNTTKTEKIIQKDTIIIYKYLPSTTSKRSNTSSGGSNILPNLSSSENQGVTFSNSNQIKTKTLNINTEKLQNKIDNQNSTSNNQLNITSKDSKVENTSPTSNIKQSSFEAVAPIQTNNALPHWYLKPLLMVIPNQAKPNSIITPPQYNKRFWLGLSGGFINYHTSWYSKDSALISRNEKSYQVGLKMEYALTEHWRIIAGGDYCPFKFKIFWQDSRYNLPSLPSYYANNPTEYRVKYSEASQKLVQGYMGLKHVFSGNKWRPYLGIAYSRMEILPFEANYQIVRISTNTEKPITVKQNQISISNIAMLNGGFEYKISPRLTAQAESFYYKDINKVKKTYDLFGLRGSLLLGF